MGCAEAAIVCVSVCARTLRVVSLAASRKLSAMSDLKVDYWALKDTVRVLGNLKSEFDDLDDRRDETRNIWGHNAVKNAMDGFASNMNHHRKDLSEEMKGVQGKAQLTLETFCEAEEELAKSFDKERPKS